MIVKFYADVLKIIWKYKIIFLLSVLCYLISHRNEWLPSDGNSLVKLILSSISILASVVLELFVILAVFKERDMLESKDDIWGSVRKIFWKGVGLQFTGSFILLILFGLSLPLLLLIFSVLQPSFVSLVVFAIWLFCVGLVGFGLFDLGICILLVKNKSVFESVFNGYKELHQNILFYTLIFVVTTFVGFVPFILVFSLATSQSGINIFAMTITSYASLVQIYLKILSMANNLNYLFVIHILLLPLQYAVVALAFVSKQSLIQNLKS